MNPYTSPLEPKGTISLQGYCFVNGKYRACEIIEASAATQTAQVRVLGSLFETVVPFRHIANVALKYGDGTILQNFGSPRIHVPESIEYIQYRTEPDRDNADIIKAARSVGFKNAGMVQS